MSLYVYMHSKVCVRITSVTKKPFRVSVGLRQGCSFSRILLLICLSGIVTKSESCGGVKSVIVTYYRFQRSLCILDSTKIGLQQALDSFSDVCCVVGIKICTTKTEIICLSRQSKHCFLQVGRVSLKQWEKFKYLSVSFTCDGRQNGELAILTGKAS